MTRSSHTSSRAGLLPSGVVAVLAALPSLGCAATGTERGAASPTRSETHAQPSVSGGDRARSAPSTAPIRDALPTAGWGPLESLRLGIEVQVPAPASWHLDDTSERWLLVAHAASHTEVRVRRWRGERVMSPERCAEQGRLWKARVPQLPAAERIVDATLGRPAGYRTWVVAGLLPASSAAAPARATSPRLAASQGVDDLAVSPLAGSAQSAGRAPAPASGDAMLRGAVVAFGACLRECLAFVFTSETAGPDAQRALAARLELAIDRLLPRVRPSRVEDRVAAPDSAASAQP